MENKMESIIPSLICDFYKTSHYNQYPKDTEFLYSTLVPRSNKYLPAVDRVVSINITGFLKKYFVNYFNKFFFERSEDEVVKEYSDFIKRTLGIDDTGDHIRKLHKLAYLPIRVKAIPEGRSSAIGVPNLTIENTHKEFAWLTNYLETLLSCSLWQPITSASIARQYRLLGEKYAAKTCDNNFHVSFQFHDFSVRGMSSLESAQTSGLGHLIYFDGTDNIPAITYADKYYSGKSAKDWNPTSIPATEHSVMCANIAKQQAEGKGRDETETYHKLITEIYPSGFVSIVSDTYDFWHNVGIVIPSLKDEIMTRNGRVVIRPDSGDPVQIICGIPDSSVSTAEEKGLIQVLWETFGGTINEKGYKVLDPHIGAIYGDSITLERAEQIFAGLEAKGFASSNVVLGIGSYTYQYHTRDSLGFAVKATSVIQNGVEYPIQKDPKTDPGKKSFCGRVKVVNDKCIDNMSSKGDYSDDELEVVFENGIVSHVDIGTIRKRALSEI
jgi:nicotinamide phosphoribosyltransferase